MYSAVSKPLTRREFFVPRHEKAPPFQLSPEAKRLYDAITKYVNTYLGASSTGGKRYTSRMFESSVERNNASVGGFSSTATQGVDMTTAATSMTTMRPGDLDELQDGELLTMFRRAPRSRAMSDAACEVLGTSETHVSRLTASRASARVSALVRPEGSGR